MNAAQLLALALALVSFARAQSPVANLPGSSAGHGRILLVLPFDNRSGQPSLEWIREAAPEILSSRFLSAGFAPMSRTDRLYALDEHRCNSSKQQAPPSHGTKKGSISGRNDPRVLDHQNHRAPRCARAVNHSFGHNESLPR